MLLYFVKVTAVVGNITFYKGNELACDRDSDSTIFTHDYNIIIELCVRLNSLPTKYHSYLLKLISNCCQFLTVNNHRSVNTHL